MLRLVHCITGEQCQLSIANPFDIIPLCQHDLLASVFSSYARYFSSCCLGGVRPPGGLALSVLL